MKQIAFIFCLALFVVSCDDIIEVEDISAKKVLALAPSNGSVITVNEVRFSWEALEDAQQYKLQIAKPGFSDAAQIELDTTVTATNFLKTLQPGTYEWRLKAENSGYQTAYAIFGFIVNTDNVVDISKEKITLLTPDIDATIDISESIDFSWEAITGASEYVFQLATPNFDNPTETLHDMTITETNFSVDNLAAGDYQWRVKAKNVIYQTDYTVQNIIIK